MHSLKHVLQRIDEVKQEIRGLRRLLTRPPLITPFSMEILLKLSKPEINCIIALESLEGARSASTVAQFLDIRRAMASQALNQLYRLGLVDKFRDHHTVMFRLKEVEG